MRVYSDELINSKSKTELREMLDSVKVSSELTSEEKDKNVQKLELALNGGVASLRDKSIVQAMMDGQADIDDIN